MSSCNETQVFVKTFNGKSLTFDVCATQTVGSLKEKIYDLEGISVKQQILVFGCKQLSDSCVLGDFSERTLQLTTSLLSAKKIHLFVESFKSLCRRKDCGTSGSFITMCELMRELRDKSKENSKVICDSEVLETIVSVLKRHTADKDIMKAGLEALETVCRSLMDSFRIFDQPVVPRLTFLSAVSVLFELSSRPLFLLSSDQPLFSHVLSALHNLRWSCRDLLHDLPPLWTSKEKSCVFQDPCLDSPKTGFLYRGEIVIQLERSDAFIRHTTGWSSVTKIDEKPQLEAFELVRAREIVAFGAAMMKEVGNAKLQMLASDVIGFYSKTMLIKKQLLGHFIKPLTTAIESHLHNKELRLSALDALNGLIYKSQSCVVCFGDVVVYTFEPCGHQCLCSECASQIRATPDANFHVKCPICRRFGSLVALL
jgi:hypothetical protein